MTHEVNIGAPDAPIGETLEEVTAVVEAIADQKPHEQVEAVQALGEELSFDEVTIRAMKREVVIAAVQRRFHNEYRRRRIIR